mmetsp:Transcript_19043/g.41399  ORF Transcript_19043/g.41399 Transcript_19043/m.41399 type:complete len:118 (-) Transcript_19043:113-466(-)
MSLLRVASCVIMITGYGDVPQMKCRVNSPLIARAKLGGVKKQNGYAMYGISKSIAKAARIRPRRIGANPVFQKEMEMEICVDPRHHQFCPPLQLPLHQKLQKSLTVKPSPRKKSARK